MARALAFALGLVVAAPASADPVEFNEAPPPPEVVAPPVYDLVIANGRVLDPETELDGVRHLGIHEGRIAEISEQPLEGKQTLDAGGLAVAPGFVDLHVHGQTPLTFDSLARDGVTSALDLEQGAHGVESFLRSREGEARIHFGVSAGHLPARIKLMHGISGGHPYTQDGFGGALRRGLGRIWKPTGYARDAADAKQIRILVRILDEQIDEGGVGIGMMLADTPGATPEEVRAVFELAAARGVPVFVHLAAQQNPDDLAPLESVLEHARKTGASLHVTQLVASLREATPRALDAIAAARAEGLLITAEVVPYDEREEWIDAALRQPEVLIASDAMPVLEQTGEKRAPQHPRAAGTHARVLGRNVRERGALSLMDALARMSWLPARRLEWFTPAMARKGRIRIGADADLVIFDPATVIDRATPEDPHQASAGIPHVLVSGVFVVRDGALVQGALPGQPLRARIGLMRSEEEVGEMPRPGAAP